MAEKRIKEIDEDHEKIETKILDDSEKIYSKLESLTETSDELLICSDIGRLQMKHTFLFEDLSKNNEQI